MSDQPQRLSDQPRPPELLAPAGARPALEAAIRAGADAVYLGAAQFSARARAENFSEHDLTGAIDLAHAHGVRIHLALNTLLSDDEGQDALRLARQAAAAGVDALIVQDIGLAVRLRQILPRLPLHASTQMTIASEEGLRWLADLGFSRVILARELSLREIRHLSRIAAGLNLETEVFVHGALCTSYSGQCFLSQLQGGRSGNRGDCAQPCRLAYRLQDAESGRTVWPPAVSTQQQDDRMSLYPWLSPRDQGLWQHLSQLGEAGVASLKIEGRMRDPDYVETVTAIYRDLLDQQFDLRDHSVQRELETRLLLAFSRGGALTDRHLTDDRQQSIRAGTISGRQGLRLGTISRINADRGQLYIAGLTDLARTRPPQAGDLLLVRREGQDDAIASAPVGKLDISPGQLIILGFHPQIMRTMEIGDQIYQLSDSRSGSQRPERGKIHLRAELRPSSDHEISLILTVLNRRSQGLQISETTAMEDRPPLSGDRLHQQLGRTGATPYMITEFDIQEPILLSIAAVNGLRRRALEQLTGAMQAQGRQPDLALSPDEDWPLQTGPSAATDLPELADLAEQPVIIKPAQSNEPRSPTPQISAYFWRLPDDLSTLPCAADRYVLPLLALNTERARQAVEIIHQEDPDHRCWVWLPAAARGKQAQIIEQLLPQLAEWGIAGCYIGRLSLAKLPLPSGLQRAADWGAHVYNQNALSWLAQQQPAVICPSTELSPALAGQLVRERSAASQAVPLEWPVYGRLRAMTIAICPIGEQEPGCRRCAVEPHSARSSQVKGIPDQARLYHLSQPEKPALRLLPHPRGCSSEIFSRQLFMADQESLQRLVRLPGQPLARLTFLEETQSERRLLVAALKAQASWTERDADASPTPNQPAAQSAGWQDLGDLVARRLNSPLEYRRLLDV